MTLPERSAGLLAGVDEAGRGPLCGAVVAAAVILDPVHPIAGLKDSKKLSEHRREALAEEIREHALCWAIAEASAAEIDSLNILQATMLAMRRAVEALKIAPAEVWVDGNRCPTLALPVQAIVKGDALVAEISAASILAKTERDRQLRELDRSYPQFGLARHKGYPTAEHLEALRLHGVPDFYRRSYRPVRELLAQGRLFE
ncbi:ribonuclease HII [Niveibacterium terrae]|uniref:ribonuclease HII n=1 Tax=Niveibacterium terrae TaxID=3373598 RepID=UPI003A93DB2C